MTDDVDTSFGLCMVEVIALMEWLSEVDGWLVTSEEETTVTFLSFPLLGAGDAEDLDASSLAFWACRAL